MSVSSLEETTYNFEPVEFSDLTLLYQNAAFRVHKYVLAKESSYFSALLKGDRTIDSVALPDISAGLGKIWGAPLMKKWLSCLYRDTALTIGEFTYDPSKTNITSEFSMISMVDFCQYFGCPRVEAQLREISSKFLNSSLIRKSPWMIRYLPRLEAAKWKELVTLYVQAIGENFKEICKEPNYTEAEWSLLSTDVQYQILAISEKHHLL